MATTNQIISRIKRRLSRGNSSTIDATILDELQQTQEWLEGRATLPSWIVHEEEIPLLAPASEILISALDEPFLRFHDDSPVQIENPDVDDDEESFSRLKKFISQEELFERHPGTGQIRGWVHFDGKIIFRQKPEEDTTIKLQYYYRVTAMAADNETVWTQNASELIIAHTGIEVAMSLRDSDAVRYFERKKAEAYADYIKRLTAEEMAGYESSRGED